jgi:hypothetical protein
VNDFALSNPALEKETSVSARAQTPELRRNKRQGGPAPNEGESTAKKAEDLISKRPRIVFVFSAFFAVSQSAASQSRFSLKHRQILPINQHNPCSPQREGSSARNKLTL